MAKWKEGESGSPENQFKPGNTMGKGRPKKFLTKLREQEGFEKLTHSQVIDIFEDLIGLTLEELKGIYEDPNSTVVEVAVAKALKTDIENGVLSNHETVMSRIFGKASQTFKHEGIPDNNIKIEVLRPKDDDDDDKEEG